MLVATQLNVVLLATHKVPALLEFELAQVEILDDLGCALLFGLFDELGSFLFIEVFLFLQV